MTPKNTIRVKNNTNECLAGNIAEKVSPWDKLFREFKKCKLSVDKLLCKEARNILQVLFKDERKKRMQEKLSENIGKPKELWKIIKKLGLPDKNAPTTSVCLNTLLTFFSRTIANTFKKHFANLASDSVKKPSDPIGKFRIPSVHQCYKEIIFCEKN